MNIRWIAQKRHYRNCQYRIAALPESYRTAANGLQRYTMHLGGIGDAGSLLAMLEDLTDLFEQAAADGTPVRGIVGDDPVEFADAFLRNYPAGQWIVRERTRLADAIDQAEGQERRSHRDAKEA